MNPSRRNFFKSFLLIPASGVLATEGNSKRLTHRPTGLGFRVTEEMFEDDLSRHLALAFISDWEMLGYHVPSVESALHYKYDLPEDTRILRCDYEPLSARFIVLLSHPSFLLSAPGYQIPFLSPTMGYYPP